MLREIVGADAEVVFDVGAKWGELATQYLAMFPKATVYAFEPAPLNFRQLVATDNPRLRAVQRAVLDHNGVIDFHISAHDGSHSVLEIDQSEFASIATIEVAAVTLDSFCKEESIDHIDFLKIDTNGADLLALEGAHFLFSRDCIKAICVEFIYHPYYKRQSRPEDIMGFLHYFDMHMIALDPIYHQGTRRYANAIFTK